jgi:methyl-accepting chemotaxis protein
MNRISFRISFAAVLAAMLARPALAAPKTEPPPKTPEELAAEAQSAQEHEALAAAETLAHDASVAMEKWIANKTTTEDRLFARMYFPAPGTSPQRYTTQYDALADHDLVPIEDKALLSDKSFQYAIVTDSNGYIPAHNTRYTKPLSGNPQQDYLNNRTKRMLADTASMIAARSEAPHLILRSKLETGEVVYDMSVPIVVRGKHWGCARVGYKKVTE